MPRDRVLQAARILPVQPPQHGHQRERETGALQRTIVPRSLNGERAHEHAAHDAPRNPLHRMNRISDAHNTPASNMRRPRRDSAKSGAVPASTAAVAIAIADAATVSGSVQYGTAKRSSGTPTSSATDVSSMPRIMSSAIVSR